MFPLLVELEKMNLQMEYISDKYNIYIQTIKKIIEIHSVIWGYLSAFEKWWEIKVLKNYRQRFSACHLELF